MDFSPVNVILSREHFILSKSNGTLWCDRRDGRLTAGTSKFAYEYLCNARELVVLLLAACNITRAITSNHKIVVFSSFSFAKGHCI